MRILYFFPRPMKDELDRIALGEVPSERAYGAVELRQKGHEVTIADSRFTGWTGPAVRKLRRHGLNVCDLTTLGQLHRYDVIVVKDDFSTMIALAAKTAGVPLVYLDSMFDSPARATARTVASVNLRLAARIVAYSRTQIALWSQRFGIPDTKFTCLPYTVDTSFYRPKPARGAARPYVLTIGRDIGRHFPSLVAAMDGLGLDLQMVTLPYLLRKVTPRPWVHVLQQVPYDELFQLYADAMMVVIPLKASVTYPSGVRGLLEALALGRPTIASRTPVLSEYVSEGEGVRYVEAENVASLRDAIAELRDDEAARAELATRGRTVVQERFGMQAFVDGFEACLQTLSPRQ